MISCNRMSVNYNIFSQTEDITKKKEKKPIRRLRTLFTMAAQIAKNETHGFIYREEKMLKIIG